MNRLLALAAFLTACAPTAPALLVTTDADFIFDTVYGPPSMHTFEWINLGDVNTGALDVTLAGDTRNFKIVEASCINGAVAKKTCQVTVSLEGVLAGSYDAELHLSNDKLYASAHLSGKVSEAQLDSKSPVLGQ